MSPETTEGAQTQPSPKGLRYKLGLWMFIIGNIITFSSPVVVSIFGLPATFVGLLVIVGEILIFGAIPVLGKKGFKELKGKFGQLLKLKFHHGAPLKPVSRFRHVVGLILVVFSLPVMQWSAAMLAIGAHKAASLDNPTPTVIGIPYESQVAVFMVLMIAGEVLTIIGFFTLGGLWWERFRKLFLWPDTVSGDQQG